MFGLNKSIGGAPAVFVCLVLIIGCSPAKPSSDISSRPEASLQEVNQALVTWSLYKASSPSNLAELQAAPFFKKRLPTPPPGQKLGLDRNGRAVFVTE